MRSKFYNTYVVNNLKPSYLNLNQYENTRKAESILAFNSNLILGLVSIKTKGQGLFLVIPNKTQRNERQNSTKHMQHCDVTKGAPLSPHYNDTYNTTY